VLFCKTALYRRVKSNVRCTPPAQKLYRSSSFATPRPADRPSIASYWLLRHSPKAKHEYSHGQSEDGASRQKGE
jgi:hypothetical protein